MNSYSFFYENFGRYFDASQSNKSHMDVSNVIRGSYPLKEKDKVGNTRYTRLAFGWAIIRPGESSIKLDLDIPGISYDSRTESMAFLEELKNWDNNPRMFLLFGKAPILISNLFLTLDQRAVRICSPKGTETFDFTQSPDDTKSDFHKRLVNLEKKLAA